MLTSLLLVYVLRRHLLCVCALLPDLSAIHSNVLMGHYGNLDTFRGDVTRMFNNCRKYNQPHTQFVACAHKLEAFFNVKMKHAFSGRDDE